MMGKRLSLVFIQVIFLAALGARTVPAEEIAHHGMAVDGRGGSEECMACHDGTLAKEVRYCTVKCAANSPHPVLAAFPPRGKERNYRPVDAVMAAGIKLVDGKVACITCHDMKNPQKFHLILDNAGSKLCLACHMK